MTYNLENLKKLREITEVGIRECIKALDANENDLEKAIEWLKVRSLSSSKSSNINESDKINKFGVVKIKNIDNKIVSFSLKCESDFVAMNNIFITLSEKISDLLLENFNLLFNSSDLNQKVEEITKDSVNEASYTLKEKIYLESVNVSLKEDSDFFGSYIHHNKKIGSFVVLKGGDEVLSREISMQLVANNPKFLSREDIPNDLMNSKIEEIKNDFASDNESSKKSPEIVEKMINGRINKWLSEICFLEQGDFRDQSVKIKEMLSSKESKIQQFSLINISK